MSDELEDSIRENALQPAKASGDSGSVEQHSLSDQIAADKYLQKTQSARSRRPGLRITKIVPTGAG
jgi:hypothetical protein